MYHRVYLVLRQLVVEGKFPPEAPMPGEHELAAEHGVSRITVRRALQMLERDGLVSRRRGAGTYARPPAAPEPVRDNLRGLIENLLAMGLRTKVRLIEFDYVPATPDIAAVLGVPTGEVVQRSVRVRSARGTPFSHLTACIPEDVGRGFRREDLAEKPLLALLEASGQKIARAEQTISAKLADATVAPLLAVDVGAALLWVRRQVCDPAGRVIEALEALYRPDMYAYQIGLVRDGAMWSPERAEA
nr:GntR family transcriptional regulator [Limobrevibacterium gyesilva]